MFLHLASKHGGLEMHETVSRANNTRNIVGLTEWSADPLLPEAAAATEERSMMVEATPRLLK
jgi:hypothetical protein